MRRMFWANENSRDFSLKYNAAACYFLIDRRRYKTGIVKWYTVISYVNTDSRFPARKSNS